METRDDVHVQSTVSSRSYEFDPQQNAVFRKLGRALKFVAVATIATGGSLGVFAALLARSTVSGSAVFGIAGVLVILVGASLFGAGGHFTRVATTAGSDIQHLMIALGKLTEAFLVQRWFWIVGCFLVLIAMFGAVASH